MTSAAFIDDDPKCFLCNHIFLECESPRLLFEKLGADDGMSEDSLATILSHALGVDLEEGLTHSNFICYSCNATVLEYDQLDKRAYELRQLIVANYNETVRLNDPQPETDALTKVLCKLEDDESNSFAEILQADGVVVENSIDMVDIHSNVIVLPTTINCNSNAEDEVQHDSNFIITDREVENFPDTSNQLNEVTVEFPNEVDGANILGFNHPETDLIIIDDTIQSIEDMYSSGEKQENMESDSNSNQAPGILISEEVDENNSLYVDDPSATFSDLIDESSSELVQDVYMCFICNIPTEHSRDDFVYHMNTVHGNKFHFCETCKSAYANQQGLRQHILREHNNNDISMEFVCQTCNCSFPNQRQLRIHKRLHYNSTKHYECTECHKRYSSKYLLEEHMNMHTGERPFKCSQCPKDFASKYTLHAHMKIHTERQRPYQCDKCDKSYLNQQHLAKHQQQHSGVKNHVCEICSKAFTTLHNLTVHQIVHTGERPFICRTCGKSFARRAEIKDHERIHTGEKPFKCDICDMAFAQRSNLMSHKKLTHLNHKHHKCDHCSRSFKRRRLLDYHIQSVHTGERPYKCKTCGATFVYPEHYKKHMVIHTGKKPYSCEVCGKLFNSQDNRNAHRFIHSDKKPYECCKCGTGFMRKPLLLAHIEQTGHYNEKIIVNRPVFNKATQELHFKSSFLVNENSEPSGEGRDAVYEIHLDDGESTEFGEATYVQFEGLDEQNPDTLTWVALRDGDN